MDQAWYGSPVRIIPYLSARIPAVSGGGGSEGLSALTGSIPKEGRAVRDVLGYGGHQRVGYGGHQTVPLVATGNFGGLTVFVWAKTPALY